MKTISLGLEDSLLKALNRRAKQLSMTRTELIRNAIMEVLLGYNDISDRELIRQARVEHGREEDWIAWDTVKNTRKSKSSE